MKKTLSAILTIIIIIALVPAAYAGAKSWAGAGTELGNSIEGNLTEGNYAIDEYGYSVSADDFEDYIEELLSESELSFLKNDLRKIDFSDNESSSEAEMSTLTIAKGNQEIKIDALLDGDKVKNISSISYSEKADLDEVLNLAVGAILYNSDQSKAMREAAQDIIEKTDGSGRVTLTVDKGGEDTKASGYPVLICVLE